MAERDKSMHEAVAASGRLATAVDTFRHTNPDVSRALDALGMNVEDYQTGLLGVSAPKVVYSTSTGHWKRPIEV